LFLPIIAYILSSTKLEIRAKLFLVGFAGLGGAGGGGVGVREGVVAWGRNNPSLICTYE
jgi:hypothetical protein